MRRTARPTLPAPKLPNRSPSPTGVCAAPDISPTCPNWACSISFPSCAAFPRRSPAVPHPDARRSYSISCTGLLSQPPPRLPSLRAVPSLLVGGVARCAPWLERRGSDEVWVRVVVRWLKLEGRWCRVGGQGR